MTDKYNDKYNTYLYVNSIYDLNFLDVYGSSLILFIIITLFVFFVFTFCKILQNKADIAADWVNQRCNPVNIPFAGFIMDPKDKSQFEYTNDNFQYCIQNVLSSIIGNFLEPFHYMLSSITNIFVAIGAAIQDIRVILERIRNSISEIASDILNRIINILTPIQVMLVAVMDTFSKIQGITTSVLYTMLGAYYTLKSFMGAMLELIIKMLIVLVIIIVGLWILPFTWPVAATMSLVFTAIAIPLAIIIYFMTEVLHVQTSGIPALRCFDKNTPFMLQKYIGKTIEELCPGDVLLDGTTVTAKIKVLSTGLDMFTLNGITVSGCHIVKYNQVWMPVRNHPQAVALTKYDEPYLYCLNTSTKTIVLNNTVFTDWDEIYNDKLEQVLAYKNINNLENITNVLDKGFNENVKIKLIEGYKSIKHVEVGDILATGGIVYGTVELNNNLGVCENDDKIYHLLVSNQYFIAENKKCRDYNYNIDSILNL